MRHILLSTLVLLLRLVPQHRAPHLNPAPLRRAPRLHRRLRRRNRAIMPTAPP